MLHTYKGKKVFVTGHTGFKGSWLTQWLLSLGAEIHGYALSPSTTPSLYNQLQADKDIHSIIEDIRDFEKLKQSLKEVQPDIVFHLAAQALVRDSYESPLETLEINVNGTANLLEAIRQLDLATTVVVITSDKCYDNKEWNIWI